MANVEGTDQVPEDELDLRDNGTVRTTIDGRTYTLRRPKVGELRRYREALDENIAKVAEDKVTPAAQTPMMVDWVRMVFNGKEATNGDKPLFGLSDHPLPDDADDWPAWFISGSLPALLINHWQNVPLARGVQA